MIATFVNSKHFTDHPLQDKTSPTSKKEAANQSVRLRQQSLLMRKPRAARRPAARPDDIAT